MHTTREDLAQALSMHDENGLKAILHASKVHGRGAETRSELAHRIADAIWWHATTPIGYATGTASLETITQSAAKRLGVKNAVSSSQPVWDQLTALTDAVLESLPQDPGVSIDDLDPAAQKRLRGLLGNLTPTLGLGGSATSAFVARWGASKVLAVLASPIGRLLPLIPPLSPYVGAIRTGAAAVKLVGGPLGIALSALTLNQALGRDDQKLVPLLLGVGALGPAPIEDAQEVSDNTPEPADEGWFQTQELPEPEASTDTPEDGRDL